MSDTIAQFDSRGYYTRKLELASFVCYLKTINTFFKKEKYMTLKAIVQGTQIWY